MPHLTNICFEHIDGENLLLRLKDVAVSTGSGLYSALFCPPMSSKPYILPTTKPQASLRFSLGRFTTEQEIDYAIGHIKEVVGEILGLQ
ncbi:MAG: hypothetical protein R2822_08750 [Spirosomataceae bacterium]